jgi:hypothetical protein
MNRLTSTLLAIALAASAGWAADPPEKKDVPLPPAVVNAENAALAAADKARSVYIKAVEAEVKKLQAMLEKEKAAATRAGNLELAMAIKAKQDAMTVDAVVAKGAESGGDLLGGDFNEVENVVQVLTSKKWIHNGRFIYTFKRDMTFVLNNTNRYGSYIISKDGKNLTLVWVSDGGKKEYGEVSSKGITVSGVMLNPVE